MAHYDLGALLIEIGDLAAGIAHLQRAIELRPTFADAHHNLAVALAVSGRVNQALVHARRACELAPGDDQACRFLAHLESKPTS